MSKQIKLTLPAEAIYARPVRMLAANLATLCGMSIDDVEDVRMVAEEGFVYSCATRTDDLELAFELDDGVITMDFSLGNTPDSSADEAVYARLLLEAMCDEVIFDEAGARLHLSKRAAG